jgi:hypothetical protein
MNAQMKPKNFQDELTPEMKLRLLVTKGRREAPGVDPRVDTLMGMIMALTSEVSVLRERLDAHERLAAQNTPATPQAVDDYVPDEQAAQARAAVRDRMVAKVCRPIIAEGLTSAEDHA